MIDVDSDKRALTVRLDRDPEARRLPNWYLDDGQADYGYALTGHKAQGVTVDHTIAIVGEGASREWAYVAMSRGRESNTAYLVCRETTEPCAHVSHPRRRDPLEVTLSGLRRGERRAAGVELGIGL